MAKLDEQRFHLTLPIDEAISFALGWSDLDYHEPHDGLRRVIGALAVDNLEYSEHWRAAATLRACLEEKWPGCFR